MEALHESAETEANPNNADNWQLFCQEVAKRIALALSIPYEMLINADNPQKPHPQT